MEYVLRQTLEREIKLKTGPQFRLPTFPGEPLAPRLFTSTYFDTADFRLARLGVTLRRRTEHKRAVWQLKLPRRHARLELELASHRSTPPEPFHDLLFGMVRHQPLTAVAKLRTHRSGIRIRRNATPVADLVMDRVAILKDRRVVGRLTEMEVELLSGKEKDLSAIQRILLQVGAQHGDPRPKVLQALNLDLSPDHPTVPVTAPPSEHLKAILRTQVRDILLHDPGTRLGKDPEELHQMRVGVRRFRALLRAARELLVPEWYASLQDELRWIGTMLGTVRDYDVLLDRLHAEAGILRPAEAKMFQRVLTTFETQCAQARAQLVDALRSERYLKLLTRLEQAVQTPAFGGAPEMSLMSLAAKEFKKLVKAGKARQHDPPDHELHQLRICTKRARYAAELAQGTMGKPAMRFVRQAKRVQDVLGDHQDAVVTEDRLRHVLQTTRGIKGAFVMGQVVERLQARRRHARTSFPQEWTKLKKLGREVFASAVC